MVKIFCNPRQQYPVSDMGRGLIPFDTTHDIDRILREAGLDIIEDMIGGQLMPVIDPEAVIRHLIAGGNQHRGPVSGEVHDGTASADPDVIQRLGCVPFTVFGVFALPRQTAAKADFAILPAGDDKIDQRLVHEADPGFISGVMSESKTFIQI